MVIVMMIVKLIIFKFQRDDDDANDNDNADDGIEAE